MPYINIPIKLTTMKHNDLTRISRVASTPQRSEAPIYKSKIVLSTGFLQNSRCMKFQENLNKLKKEFPSCWFVHFERCDHDPAKLIYSVTNVLYSLNKSRPLRRARVTGIRACCLLTEDAPRLKYICDMGITSWFGTSVIASGLLQYFEPSVVEVDFSPSKRVQARSQRAAMHETHLRLKDRFFQRSGLTENTVHIENISEGAGFFESIAWRISTSHDLLNVVNSLVDILGREISSIHFKNKC